ncbi:DUF6966 domain-containing protein [Actibacterium lipolyticum]|uniref:DUF6966 domain-containing protein n=1 Tax=Actibacterium lipolyticum TaxID=1524263 RepID=A0A238JMJ9_9RHOB|nr:hypothetical protein COL8621_00436 [Actibacterium lipolyticum]
MKPPNLHPDLVDFMESLTHLEKLLAQHEKGHWLKKVRRVRQIAENSDGYCVQLFLGLYGGMGSFNDLVLDAPASANDLLHRERRRAYELAQVLR